MTQPITRRADALLAEWAEQDEGDTVPISRAGQELELVGDDYVLAYADKVVSLVLDHPFAFEDGTDESYPLTIEVAQRALDACIAIDRAHERSWFRTGDDEPCRIERAFRYFIAGWQDSYETDLTRWEDS